MKFRAEIDIMPLKELLDPQGKAVGRSMGNLNIAGVQDVRVGKHVTMILEASTQDEANTKIDEACRRLLANLIMESYTFQMQPMI